MKRVLWILLACMLVFTGCKTRAKRNLLPNVSGKAGEVLVVIERADWEADLGVAIGAGVTLLNNSGNFLLWMHIE